MPGGEVAQALLILVAQLAIGLDDALEDPQPGRALARGAHVAAVEVGIAAVQQPVSIALDGDPGVPEAVAREGDHQHLRVAAGQHAHALEAEPLVATELVRDPLRPVGPMHLPDRVAGALAHRRVHITSCSRAQRWTAALGKSGRPPA